jgi:hypothetical protein
MDELICKISDDSTFMLIAAISVVILIFVLLVVVISSMRIKGYKNRFINSNIDNQEKDALIEKLQEELQSSKIKNVQNEQELQLFAHTKERLKETEEKLEKLQTSDIALQKLQAETRTELDHTLNSLAVLTEEHKTLSEKFEALQDDNNKLHINNARLLMKLESEARFNAEMTNRSSTENK